MTRYKATLRVDIVRYVEAGSEDEALDKVDSTNMNYELNYDHGGGSFIVQKIDEQDRK